MNSTELLQFFHITTNSGKIHSIGQDAMSDHQATFLFTAKPDTAIRCFEFTFDGLSNTLNELCIGEQRVLSVIKESPSSTIQCRYVSELDENGVLYYLGMWMV